MKPSCFGVLNSFDESAFHHHLWMLGGERAKVLVGLLPVRTVIEVEQRHVHGFTVNLAQWFKVKGYCSTREDR